MGIDGKSHDGDIQDMGKRHTVVLQDSVSHSLLSGGGVKEV